MAAHGWKTRRTASDRPCARVSVVAEKVHIDEADLVRRCRERKIPGRLTAGGWVLPKRWVWETYGARV